MNFQGKSSSKMLLMFLILLSSLVSSSIQARPVAGVISDKDQTQSKAAVPAYCRAAHRVGKIVLAVSNNGTFGTGFASGPAADCFTGGDVPSCEYPKNSNVTYLYSGAFWIGAIVGRDTLVSTGAESTGQGREFYPDESPFGDMFKRSIIDPESPLFDGAVSEEDFIAVYTDTLTKGVTNDYFGRPHRPLNIEVTQRSFAWSYAYAEDFVLFDYSIKNIGQRNLEKVYMGIFVDADICFDCGGTQGYLDDISGFAFSLPSAQGCGFIDTVVIAWTADNDGDLRARVPAPHVTGTRIVRTPADTLNVAYNWYGWWGGNDWGPREQGNVGRLQEPFRDLRTGRLGIPRGDVNKYYFMRNQEFDYDQVFTCAIQQTDSLWLYPPRDLLGSICDGLDTRYLLSFGPFDISPGQSLPISFAYVAGANLHKDPGNINNLPDDPVTFYKNLDFSDLGLNSAWASWIYDNPGVDTDNDGYAGKVRYCVLDSAIESVDSSAFPWDTVWASTVVDTVFYEGDGVPDFRGASPPPAPKVYLESQRNAIKVRFNGFRSETTRDVFSREIDFEGYRVYFARDERSASYVMVASYDIEDYNKYVFSPNRIGGAGYELTEAPFTLQELRCLYGDSCNDLSFDPEQYTQSNQYIHPLFPNDSIFYFQAEDYNVSQLGVSTGITKVYPDQPYPSSLEPDSVQPDELTPDGDLKFFEYKFTIDNLLPTVPYWVNVTAFDFGSPKSGLSSLETSVTVGSKSAYPGGVETPGTAGGLNVYIYPNPYRIDAGYRIRGFEGRVDTDRPDDRLREINFENLPPKCTIKIFTIDGDLVREIEHDIPVSDPKFAHDSWNLITRNTQLVVSGIYYWVIESENGETQIGKLVVIM